MLPPQDPHAKCVRCLAGVGHDPEVCQLCLAFTPKARKKRAADLMFFREIREAGGDPKEGVPPSKAKKVETKLRKARKGRASSPIPIPIPIQDKEVVSPPVQLVDANFLQSFLQQHMESVSTMVRESVEGLRKEFLSGSTGQGSAGSGAGATASVGAPGGCSSVPDLDSAPELPPTIDDRGLGPVPFDVLAAGPLAIPGFSDPLATVGYPIEPEPAVPTAPVRESRDRGPGGELVQPAETRPSGPFAPLTPSASVSEARSGVGPVRDFDFDQATDADPMDVEEEEGTEENFNLVSALREVRQRIAVVLPQAAVPEPRQDPAEFRLPGEAFAPRQRPQTRLRVLPSLVRDVVDPLLSGTRSRFDLPDLVKRYQMGDDDLFSVPVVDECVFTSVALGGASASSLATPVARQGRHIPPFTLAGPSLKAAYRCFEEQFRNAGQQMRVVVHGAYLSSLQRSALEAEKDSGDVSPSAVLLRQLTEVQSHLARDSLRSAASQMMSAVMGMRRLWLSTSRYSAATQQSLLALPFRLGSTLFPGAQQVVREAAEAVASFKDSKALLEQPRPPRARPPASGTSSSAGPTPNPNPWLQPLGRGKKRSRKGKGRGKAAGGAQQPFRGRGGSSQTSL